MADSKRSREEWIELEVANYLKSIDADSMPEFIREELEESYRERLNNPRTPHQILFQKLGMSYAQPDGSLLIPEEAVEDRALEALLKEHATMHSALGTIARGGLSTESETIYADGGDLSKRSSSNAVFTPAQVAVNGLKAVASYR